MRKGPNCALILAAVVAFSPSAWAAAPAGTQPVEAAAEPGDAGPSVESELRPTPEPSGGDATAESTLPAPTLAPTLAPPPPPVVEQEVDPRNYGMVLGGDILIGASGAALIAMAVGLGVRHDAIAQRAGLASSGGDDDARERQDQRIQTGTIVAVSGGAAAGALLAAGITLVALGYARGRKRRLELPSASFGRGHVGLSWSLRF